MALYRYGTDIGDGRYRFGRYGYGLWRNGGTGADGAQLCGLQLGEQVGDRVEILHVCGALIVVVGELVPI